MNVSLPPLLDALVKQKLAKGACTSESEVVGETLRLMAEFEALQAQKLDTLRGKIDQGLASLESGLGKPLDVESIKTKGRRELERDGLQQP